MAYIGKTPTIGNFQVCDAISVVNGQAAYTMQVGSVNVSPESANHMLVSLNGILQKAGSSFTVSGSTITFASNLVTGDVIDFIQILGNVLDLGVPSDATVSLAKLTATGTKDATTFLRGDNTFASAGITMADQFRLSADQSGGTNAIVTSNLERVDTDGFGQLGTGMTESSGVFTFPSTGIYLIQLIGFINIRADGAGNVSIETTTDNSTFTDACIVTAGNNDSSGAQQSVAGNFIFDVTNTSTHKFHLKTHSMASGSYLMGETDRNRTTVTVIRLGDT
nr:c1q globular head like domain containing protein [uncultured Mediterranean phage uvMED]